MHPFKNRERKNTFSGMKRDMGGRLIQNDREKRESGIDWERERERETEDELRQSVRDIVTGSEIKIESEVWTWKWENENRVKIYSEWRDKWRTLCNSGNKGIARHDQLLQMIPLKWDEPMQSNKVSRLCQDEMNFAKSHLNCLISVQNAIWGCQFLMMSKWDISSFFN